MRIFNLTKKTGNLTSNDFFGVDNGSTVNKIDYNALAKAIIEQYTGSTLAGSAQSVKAALDALNSKSSLTLSYTANDYVNENSFKLSSASKVGNLFVLKLNVTIAQFPSGNNYDNTQIGAINGWNANSTTNVLLPPQNGTSANGIILLAISPNGIVTISNRSGLPCNGFYRATIVSPAA